MTGSQRSPTGSQECHRGARSTLPPVKALVVETHNSLGGRKVTEDQVVWWGREQARRLCKRRDAEKRTAGGEDSMTEQVECTFRDDGSLLKMCFEIQCRRLH